MKNKTLLEYNLFKISEIDKQLIDNNKKKDIFLKYHSKRFKIHSFLEKLTNRIFQSLLIIITTIIVYILFVDPIYSIIISLNIIIFVNLVIMIFVTLFETKDGFLMELCNYRKEYNELIKKRSYYINLYNYALNGDQTILNNIKLRINKGSYCEYDKANFLNLKNSSYESKTLKIMSKKEKLLRESIKNKIFWELNSPNKTENLSDAELNYINEAL